MNISESTAFLIRPLQLAECYAPSTLNALRKILNSGLELAYAAMPDGILTLSFSTTATLPPRPVYAACIAANVDWADWSNRLLGARGDFDLTIRPRSVFVAYHHHHHQSHSIQHVPVWVQPSDSLVPPTQNATTNPSPIITSTIPVRLGETRPLPPPRKGRTLAQQLLESNDKEETEELFSMISGVGLVEDERLGRPLHPFIPRMHPMETCHPIPMHPTGPYPHHPHAVIPASDIHVSRASSPFSSSSCSASDSGSWSGCGSSSEEEEDAYTTSPSSIGSTSPLTSSPPVCSAFPRVDGSSVPKRHAPQATFPRSAPHWPRFAPTHVPQQQQQRYVAQNLSIHAVPFVRGQEAQPKKDVTKYLYQGGVSTTLTGGVMLGKKASTPSANTMKPPSTYPGSQALPPRYRAHARAPIQNQNHVFRPTQAPPAWHHAPGFATSFSRF